MIWRRIYDLRSLDFDFCRRIGNCVFYGPEIRKKAICTYRHETAYHARHFVGGEEVNERTLKDIESELNAIGRLLADNYMFSNGYEMATPEGKDFIQWKVKESKNEIR